jgi:hypothetical protein
MIDLFFPNALYVSSHFLMYASVCYTSDFITLLCANFAGQLVYQRYDSYAAVLESFLVFSSRFELSPWKNLSFIVLCSYGGMILM